jgi:DNA modification methylase
MIINEQVALVDCSAIRPHPDNPRVGNIEQIRQSIRKNGFYGFCIVQSSTGYILAGNHRYMGAVAEGFEKIPVAYVNVDDRTARNILLADNHTSDVAEYNEAKLAQILQEIAGSNAAAAAANLEGTGYSSAEVDELVANVERAAAKAAATTEGLTDEDAVPEPRAPLSRAGDLWVLGNHRLLCGDSTNGEHVSRLMGAILADLVVTDPPYNVAYEGKTKDALTIKNDSMSGGDFYAFLLAVYQNLAAQMKGGSGIYVFHADTEGVSFRKAMTDAGLKLAQCCVWVKQSLVMGRQDYHWQHEPVLYGWKPTASHRWYSDRKQTTVWRFDRPSRNGEHPTMKPVELIGYPIQNSSREGDVVLDLFGGSGSTLIACEKLGRYARLMELDPKYVDVIVRRWQDFTGKTAVREDGVSFRDLEAQDGVVRETA